MRLIAYAISGVLIFFGLVIGAMLPSTAEYADIPAKPISAGVLLFVWGLLLQYSTRRNYRGGAATYIGMILFGLGVWHAVGIVTWLPGVELPVNIAASILLTVGGAALLVQGHKSHIRIKGETKRSDSID